MKKSSFFLLTTILSFYSNISAAETTKWLQANLISDVGSKGGEKYVFSLSPQSLTMNWGIKNDCNIRYLGYFIMIRVIANDHDGPWEFLDNAYLQATKYNIEDPTGSSAWTCDKSLPTFPAAIKTLKNRTSVSSSANHGVFTSYCVGFGYSSYTGQSSSSRDGRPKRADGTDINFNDSDLSCGRYIYDYIPCKAQVNSLDLKFGNVDFTSLNTAKATASLRMNCVSVPGLGSNLFNAFRIKLNKGNGIALNNGTEASIYINDKKITSANNDAENFSLSNTTASYNLTVSATLSGTPTKMGNFEGSGYLVMEYF